MTRSAALVVALVLCASACSSSKSIDGAGSSTGSTGADTTEVDDSTTSSTVEDSTTSSFADTAAPSTDPVPEELVLRDNGVGPYVLGDEAGMVVEGLTDQLGFPATDFTAEYPDDSEVGQYASAEGDTGFVAPFGRSVCWEFGFCAEFGGGSMAAMSFTGWTYRDDTARTLASESGATIGSTWAEVPSMDIPPGGCYSQGSGTVDGIRLILLSSGTPFSEFDAGGNYVANLPEPENTTVTSMEIGEVPYFLFGDC